MKNTNIKKYIAVLVATAILTVSAIAQTVNIVNLGLDESVCLATSIHAPTICVEVTSDTPHVVAEYYLKEGHRLVIGNQLFFNVSGVPQFDPLPEPVDSGSTVYLGHRFSHVWRLDNDQSVNVNNLNRVIGVPSDFAPTSGRVWQLNAGQSIAFVFNKKGNALGLVKNPTANHKWPKNTFVTIVNG